jgi:hypothetical protein
MQPHSVNVGSAVTEATDGAPLFASSSTRNAKSASFASRPVTAASSSSSVHLISNPPKKKQIAFLRKSKESGDIGVSSSGVKARCIWVGLPKAFLSLYDFKFSAGSAQADFERLHANRDFDQAADVLEGYMCVVSVSFDCIYL